jgi:hypothetical protein
LAGEKNRYLHSHEEDATKRKSESRSMLSGEQTKRAYLNKHLDEPTH